MLRRSHGPISVSSATYLGLPMMSLIAADRRQLYPVETKISMVPGPWRALSRVLTNPMLSGFLQSERQTA